MRKKGIIYSISLLLKKHLLVNKLQSNKRKKRSGRCWQMFLLWVSTARVAFHERCPDPEISDEQISGICVFEKGEGCGGGVGWRPRVTITRSAHITHVASLWAMGCLVGLGFWRSIQGRPTVWAEEHRNVHSISVKSLNHGTHTLAFTLQFVLWLLKRSVPQQEERAFVCTHGRLCSWCKHYLFVLLCSRWASSS